MEELIKKIETLRDNFKSKYALEENAYTKACEDILDVIEQLRQYNVSRRSEQLSCAYCEEAKPLKYCQECWDKLEQFKQCY